MGERGLKPTIAIRALRMMKVQLENSLPEEIDTLLLDYHDRMISEATKEAEQDNLEAIEAIDMAIKAIKETAKCDRCHRAKAVEFSESTDMCYCKRCYRAVTNEKSPY